MTSLFHIVVNKSKISALYLLRDESAIFMSKRIKLSSDILIFIIIFSFELCSLICYILSRTRGRPSWLNYCKKKKD